MEIKGITKRWIKSALLVTGIIFASVVAGVSLIVKGYIYNCVKNKLIGKSEELSIMIRGTIDTDDEFRNTMISYVDNIDSDGREQVSVCDSKNTLIVSSDGPWNNDYRFFKKGHENKVQNVWSEKLPSGERVMTLTKKLFNSKGNYLGSVKYIISLKKTSSLVIMAILILCVLGTVAVLFIVFIGISFIKSIIDPITDISKTAKLIAQGNFAIKINKKYDDEVGELCDTINDMARELGTAERMKNDFISSVSHEIRTPLTAIKGWAETMQFGDEIDKSVIKKGLDIIVHETERLSGIVEELLDFSRLQSGRMNISVDKLDILAELGEAVYIFKERAISENKTLIYNEPKMISPIMGDRNRLKQVFINVIDNAVKYTSEGGGISVSVVEKDNKVCVSVTDNGCGISGEHLPRITEKFYKANNLQRGSGIGLAIVREIVEMHGGNVEILSEEGFGTTVNIFLPVIKGDIEVEYVQTEGNQD